MALVPAAAKLTQKRKRITPVPASASVGPTETGSEPASSVPPSPLPAEAAGPVSGDQRATRPKLNVLVGVEAESAAPAPEARADTGGPDGKAVEDCWAVDSTGTWEVWAKHRPELNTLVQGLRESRLVWEHVLHQPVRQLAVDGDFVAVASGLELHVLRLSCGKLCFPPCVLTSAPVHLDLNARGQLLVLLRDASLKVWDVSGESCVADTSLRHLCAPGDVELVDVKPKTGEPLVQLSNQRLFLFHRAFKRWVALTEPPPGPPGPNGDSAEFAIGGGSGSSSMPVLDGRRLEADLLVSACVGIPEEVERRLDALVRHIASQDPGKLREWCAVLLGRHAGAAAGGKSSGSAALSSWLPAELEGMGLAGTKLVLEVVLPVLGELDGELYAEIEHMAAAAREPEASAPAVF